MFYPTQMVKPAYPDYFHWTAESDIIAGMKRLWTMLAIVVPLAVGCEPKAEAPPVKKPPIAANQTAAEPPTKPIAKPKDVPGAKLSACPHRDEFNLPLIIHIDAPEVPFEIQKPSPPIKQTPAAFPEMPNPLRPPLPKPKLY